MRGVGGELQLPATGELDGPGRAETDQERRQEDRQQKHRGSHELGGDEDALDVGQLRQALAGDEQAAPVPDRDDSR